MSTPSDQIRIRPCAAGDEEQLAELLYNNFPDPLEPSQIQTTWLWQFRNTFSKAGGVAVAELDGNIVAQYAVMTLPARYQGRDITGAVSTATVTDKSARGQGLFTKLAAKVYDDIAAQGVGVVFGFPNSQSISGFTKRLDWFEIAPGIRGLQPR